MADPTVKSGTQAAIDAGYSPNSARVIASQNLAKLNIREEIEKRKVDAAKIAGVEPETVLGATVKRAFGSINDCLDENGNFDIQIARQTGAIDLVQSIDRVRTQYGESIRIKMYSAAEAQRELGEYLGLKNLPREQRTRLQELARLVKEYLLDYPQAELDCVVQLFARNSGEPAEKIMDAYERLEDEGVGYN